MYNPFTVEVIDDPYLLHKKVEVHIDPTVFYPPKPLASMAVADEMLAASYAPKDVLVAQVAKHMGKKFQKMVEDAVYSALTGMPTEDSLIKKLADYKAQLTTDWGKVTVSEDALKQADYFWGATYQSTYKSAWDNLYKNVFGGNPESQVHPSLATLAKAIPGFTEMKQGCPEEGCSWSKKGVLEAPLHRTIIHLNDSHHWTREAIADWLETLDHDLQFKTPEEVKNGNEDG